jgi:hypothetical protein
MFFFAVGVTVGVAARVVFNTDGSAFPFPLADLVFVVARENLICFPVSMGPLVFGGPCFFYILIYIFPSLAFFLRKNSAPILTAW